MLLALFLTCFVALAAATALKSQRFRWCSEACRSCASTGGVATLGPASRQPAVGLPGLGQLAWPSVTTQDLPVIIGTVLVASAFIVVANLLVDLGYALLDPRVRPS